MGLLPRWDWNRWVVYNVHVLGPRSQNGLSGRSQVRRRIYTPLALLLAPPLVEGAPVFIEHPVGDRRQPRDPRTAVGVIRDVWSGSEGLYGDLWLNRRHPRAAQLRRAVWQASGQFGLSINADTLGTIQGDAWVVEQIVKVRSVDLVRYPATSPGLFGPQR